MAQLKLSDQAAVRERGRLGDGAALTDGSFLSSDARVPLFMPLYHHRGAIPGWLDVNAGGTVQGTTRWLRPDDSRSLDYPAGFAIEVPVTGSRSP